MYFFFVTGKEVQKRWKNVKDCFARELAVQKKTKSGEPAKKRRKYIYFDTLLFLLPHQQPRSTSSNVEPPDDNSEPSNDNAGSQNDLGDPQNDNGEPPNEEIPARPVTQVSERPEAPQQRTPRSRPNKSSRQTATYENSLLDILKQKQSEEISEDKHFALMLVPMLAKLNDNQKHFAKIEILNVMKNARSYSTPVLQQQTKTFSPPGPSTGTKFCLRADPQQYQTSVGIPAVSPQYSDNSTSLQSYYSQVSNDILSPTSPEYSELYDIS